MSLHTCTHEPSPGAPSRPLRAWLFVLLFLLGSTSAAQTPKIRFHHLTPAEGLSQDIVRSIAHDSAGFMWFGTEDGLNRYDGHGITTYKHIARDTTSLWQSGVATIFVDSKGRVWVSAGGLHRYDEVRDNFRRIRLAGGSPVGSLEPNIKSIAQDRSGALWLGTDRGLLRWEPETESLELFVRDPRNRSSLSSDSVYSIVTGRDGDLWIGTQDGLTHCEPVTKTFTRYLTRENLPPSQALGMIVSIYEDAEGILWLATVESGLVRFDPRTSQATVYKNDPRNANSLRDNVVAAISEDGRGRLWLGHFSGLDLFDPRTEIFEHFSAEPSDPFALRGARVYAILAGPQGSMWCGTYHGGVEYYDPWRNRFDLLRNVPGRTNQLAANDVRAVLEDSEGLVWVGTSAGIDLIDPSLTVIQNDPVHLGFNGRAVLSITEDRRRDLWFGLGEGRRLMHYDRRTKRLSPYPFQDVRVVFEDRRGDFWFGTVKQGLVLYSPSRQRTTWFSSRPHDRDSLHGEGVWCITEDTRGRLWIGTDGDGQCLNRYDPATGRFAHFTPDPADRNSISGISIRDVYQDSSDVFWFAVWGEGLASYTEEGNRWATYLESDGLPNNYLKGILSDRQGFLWVSSEKGLSRFDPGRRLFQNFTIDDGLQGNRFLSRSRSLGRNGRMYFGGENGLNVFHPDSILDRPTFPSVRITAISVLGKPLPLATAPWRTSSISLSYDQDVLALEYLAIDYTAPDRIRYAYKMEGLEDDWAVAGKRRYAAYTHLDAGTYIFHVKATNSDGMWDAQGSTLLITVAPPYWKTWWFRSLIAVAVALLLYGAYRFRISQILAVENLRQRIARDLHDDVGTNLSTISLASQALAGKLSPGTEEQSSARRISTIARATSDLMRDIVWLLKTNNDSIGDLVLKMREVARQLLSSIPFTFNAPRDGLSGSISLEFKRNVLLFFKETLNNVVRHSGATEVTIDVRYGEEHFTLRVQDNGRGFNPKEIRSGSGLDNLEERARTMGGSVKILSNSIGGSEVILSVKMTHMRHGARNISRLS